MKTENVSQTIASSLIAHESRAVDPADDLVQPVTRAIFLTIAEVSRWVGPHGCRALLGRALARAALQHSALSEIRVVSNSAPAIVGVEECVRTHGPRAAAAGLTAALAQMFEVLERLIGDQLTLRLANQIAAENTPVMGQEKEVEDQRND